MQMNHSKLILCALAAALCLLPGCAASAAPTATASASSTAVSASETIGTEAASASQAADSADSSPKEENTVTGRITAIDGSTITVQPGGRPTGNREPPAGNEEAPTSQDNSKGGGQGRPEPPDGEAAPDGSNREGKPGGAGEAPGTGEKPNRERPSEPDSAAPGDASDGKGFTPEGDPVTLTLTGSTVITPETRGRGSDSTDGKTASESSEAPDSEKAMTLSELTVGSFVTAKLDSSGAVLSLTVRQMNGPSQGGQGAPQASAASTDAPAPAAESAA